MRWYESNHLGCDVSGDRVLAVSDVDMTFLT